MKDTHTRPRFTRDIFEKQETFFGDKRTQNKTVETPIESFVTLLVDAFPRTTIKQSVPEENLEDS
jgi:hypothetical protein